MIRNPQSPWTSVVRFVPHAVRARRPGPSPAGPVLLFRAVMCGLLLGLSTGCHSLTPGSDGMFDMSDLLDTSRIRGPLERSLTGQSSVLDQGRKYSLEGQQKLDAAIAEYAQGRRSRAIRQLKSVAREFRDTSAGEEAQFRTGEYLMAEGRLPEAQDAFDQLFVDYPSTRYVEPASRHLFRIARTWLEVSEPAARSDIRLVSSEATDEPVPAEDDAAGPPRDPTLRYRILPNFHDRSRPVFDTQGRALQALKAIWLNDPTGPLADDALMLTATYYMRRNNHVEADRYFEILREEYPDSPHLEEAFLLGSHVKLMSYQGAHYEGITLTGAEKLKEQSLHLFPASEERSRLRKDLSRLYLLQAERKFARVEYYQKKGRPRAVAVACMSLISEFPDTRFADEARRILAAIDRQELQGLPEVDDFLSDLPPRSSPESSGPPVKSVSDSRATDEGRVRL